MPTHLCPQDRAARQLDELLRAPPRSATASMRLAFLRAALAELREAGWSARDQRATLAPAVVRLWRSDLVDEPTRIRLRRWLDLELEAESDGRTSATEPLPS